MAILYKGDIKSLFIRKLEVEENMYQLHIFDTILLKDELFYLDKFGEKVSFKFNKVLNNREEAEEQLLDNNIDSVLFVDYENLKFVEKIDSGKFKQLKKEYDKSNER